MRVAHIAPSAKSEISAAWRIRKAQAKNGIDAFALVHSGDESPTVQLMRHPSPFTDVTLRLEARLDGLPIRFSRRPDPTLPWSSGWSGYKASTRIERSGAAIANMHWATSGCVNLHDLRNLKMPVVMTLHDVWPVTGGCHCNLGCEGWRVACTTCPQLTSGPLGLRLPNMLWRHKFKAYQNIPKLSIVSPSHWLAGMAIESGIFQDRDIHVIRNCIDTDLFSPIANHTLRVRLGISPETVVIVFGAVNALSTSYKGYDLLETALQLLPHLSDRQFHLIVFGADDGRTAFNYPVNFLGTLNDEAALAAIYQAADVFVTPSRQDNYPSTVLEATSCGVPVVGFDVGGIPEMVDHRKSGYIARSFDAADLASGIAWVAEDDARRNQMGLHARKVVELSSAQNIVAAQYGRLYHSLLEDRVEPVHLSTLVGVGRHL